ncbi:MAG: autotransporter-associated beta strand repeat-containing protein [Chthoniobacteraceae bacterium]|jgi:autotransporter-associated beta strand protein
MTAVLGLSAHAQLTWSGSSPGTTTNPTSGTWDTSSLNWNGSAWTNSATTNAIFGGADATTTPITVTVATGITADAIEFTSTNDNYTLSAASPETITVNTSIGNSGNGNPADNADIEVAPGATLTIGTNVTVSKTSASNGFEIAGTTFGGTDTAGTVDLNGGTISEDVGIAATVGNLLLDGITVNVNSGGLINTNFAGNGGNQENIQMGRDGNGSSTLNVNNGGTVTINAAADIYVGRSDKGYTGTQTLNINSGGTFSTGAMVISEGIVNLNGGTLSVGTNADSGVNIGNGGLGGANGTFNFNGGTLEASGATGTFMNASLTAANVESGGAIINTNGFAITIEQPLLNGGGTDGGLTVNDTTDGAGALTLTGANTYNGGTTVNAGTLTVGAGGTLGATTGALTVDSTGGGATVLNLATGVSTTVGSLSGVVSGGGTATINTDPTGGNFDVDQTVPGTFAGAIDGAGVFVLDAGSTSKLTLSGTSFYSGGTEVGGGTLAVTGALSSSGALTVNSGATFALGEAAGGESFVSQLVSTLSLISAGGVDSGQEAVLGLDIGTGMNSDSIVSSGPLTLTGTQSFKLDIAGTPSGLTYDLLEWVDSGSTPITASNIDLTLDGVSLGLGSPDLSIVNDGGTDILELTAAVPEPGTYGMLLGGLGLLLVAGRKRLGRARGPGSLVNHG